MKRCRSLESRRQHEAGSRATGRREVLSTECLARFTGDKDEHTVWAKDERREVSLPTDRCAHSVAQARRDRLVYSRRTCVAPSQTRRNGKRRGCASSARIRQRRAARDAGRRRAPPERADGARVEPRCALDGPHLVADAPRDPAARPRVAARGCRGHPGRGRAHGGRDCRRCRDGRARRRQGARARRGAGAPALALCSRSRAGRGGGGSAFAHAPCAASRASRSASR